MIELQPRAGSVADLRQLELWNLPKPGRPDRSNMGEGGYISNEACERFVFSYCRHSNWDRPTKNVGGRVRAPRTLSIQFFWLLDECRPIMVGKK